MQPILDQEAFKKTLDQMSQDLLSLLPANSSPVFIGVHTRGIPLAQRLIHKLKLADSPLGTLDINLYRDDLSLSSENPVLRETRIDFDVTGRTVILVDDVLFTGRTVRAAMDAIFDHGRPLKIILVVMADRDGRELPIQPDVAGVKVLCKSGDNVKVCLEETDGKDQVFLQTPDVK